MMVVALTGCGEPESAKLERQLEMMKQGATAEELCTKKQEIAAAYLSEENKDKYQFADIEAKLACNQVLLDRL